MERYTVIIFWSDEDQAFIAAVEELEGCSAWGETREEALHEVETAIDLWLQTARDHGDPIPEPRKYRDVA